jgi:hypothetical protein
MPKHWQLVKIATTAVFAGIRDTDKMENEFVNDFVREIFLLVDKNTQEKSPRTLCREYCQHA